MRAETPCEAEGCNVLCLARTCSNACRSMEWKARTGYKDHRSVRNVRQRRSRASKERRRTRYAVVQVKGAVMEILAFDSATSKRAVERAFGISERSDLEAIAARHLPTLSTCSQ